MGKHALFAAIGIALGFGLGFTFGTGKFAKPAAGIVDACESAKAKLQALADTDLADYARLKDLEVRYRKADEILGKILVIFLADLGIRTKLTEALAKAAQDPGAREDVKAAVKAAEAIAGNVAKSAEAAKKVAAGATTQSWTEQEKGFEDVSSESDAKAFLDQVKVEDFDRYLRSSAVFTNRSNLVDALNGRFEGTSLVNSGDSKPQKWEFSLDLNAKMQGTQLKGKYQVTIKVDGKPNSDNVSDGTVQNLREFGAGGHALIVHTGPDSYFQVFYVKSMDALIANVYERNQQTLDWAVVTSFTAHRTR